MNNNSEETQNLLILLVGESGAGKSTLCRHIGHDANWYSSSGAIVEALSKEEVDINHDTIHAFANRAYAENPEWQVPAIIEALHEKGALILDGPRRLLEVVALKREVPNCKVIRVVADPEVRFKRLQSRDGVDREAFERILKDEAEETEVFGLLSMADYEIVNNGTEAELKKEADKIAEEIEKYSIDRREWDTEPLILKS